MIAKKKYNIEYEIRSSPKILFNFISTPNGLAQWFADDVNLDPQKNFVFIWDNQKSPAKKTIQKLNQQVKYEFISKDPKDNDDPSYIEFNLEESELTQTSFLKIIDYSEIESEQDMQELYQSLVHNLKEIVGGK